MVYPNVWGGLTEALDFFYFDLVLSIDDVAVGTLAGEQFVTMVIAVVEVDGSNRTDFSRGGGIEHGISTSTRNKRI